MSSAAAMSDAIIAAIAGDRVGAAQELRVLSRALVSAADQIDAGPTHGDGPAPAPYRQIRRELIERKARAAVFPDVGVHHGMWGILLDLYVYKDGSSLISVSSACIASGVPMTTALRQIKQLTDIGLVTRSPDPFDKRKLYLSLSPVGVEAMDRYVAKVEHMLANRLAGAA